LKFFIYITISTAHKAGQWLENTVRALRSFLKYFKAMEVLNQEKLWKNEAQIEKGEENLRMQSLIAHRRTDCYNEI